MLGAQYFLHVASEFVTATVLFAGPSIRKVPAVAVLCGLIERDELQATPPLFKHFLAPLKVFQWQQIIPTLILTVVLPGGVWMAGPGRPVGDASDAE